jgi:pimeloyl-ACP methyl ester carboxylesterase
MNRGVQACLAAVMMLALAGGAPAQPTFGGPKPKPKGTPVEAPDGKRPAAPGPPKPVNPGVTQPPEEWSGDDPERRKPDTEAKPGEWYCWKTSDGLRYAWSLPAKFEKGKAYDVVVMLHPDRMDFRWGVSNHLRGEDGFRPDCIAVSVDGMAANAKRPELRTFEPTTENCVRFRDVLLEFSRVLPARHLILYGQGGGGRFASYFGMAFPALADGVLDFGGGIAANKAAKSTVPMVFMHGAKDSITPLSASVEACKAFQDAGHKGVRLRTLRKYNDFPNQNCAADCVDYLRAMRTDDPAEALEIAARMLTVKPADEFGYVGTPWFAGAMGALSRITGGADDPYKFEKEPSAEVKKKADALAEKIEREGEANATNIRTLLRASGMEKGDFVLDGEAWLGYMLAVRDDFRGVKSVEKLAAELKLDEQIAAHAEAARDLWTTWNVSASEGDKYQRAVEQITKCFLCEALPVDLLPRCRACMKKANELEIDSESRNLFEFIQHWDHGWSEGLEVYELRWQNWSVE